MRNDALDDGGATAGIRVAVFERAHHGAWPGRDGFGPRRPRRGLSPASRIDPRSTEFAYAQVSAVGAFRGLRPAGNHVRL